MTFPRRWTGLLAVGSGSNPHTYCMWLLTPDEGIYKAPSVSRYGTNTWAPPNLFDFAVAMMKRQLSEGELSLEDDCMAF